MLEMGPRFNYIRQILDREHLILLIPFFLVLFKVTWVKTRNAVNTANMIYLHAAHKTIVSDFSIHARVHLILSQDLLTLSLPLLLVNIKHCRLSVSR